MKYQQQPPLQKQYGLYWARRHYENKSYHYLNGTLTKTHQWHNNRYMIHLKRHLKYTPVKCRPFRARPRKSLRFWCSLHHQCTSSHGVDSLQWRHNERDGVSNHQPHDCLLNRLFRRRSKKTSNSASLAYVRGIHRWPVNSPPKGPVTRKMFSYDDVITIICFVPREIMSGITRALLDQILWRMQIYW